MFFLILFTTVLFIAAVYCFKTNKYLHLYIPCMLFLPNYYGIEINDSLPVISVSRIMLLIFYLYAFINRKRSLNFSISAVKTLPKQYIFLAGYFLLRMISNSYYILTYNEAVKTLFSIIFEQLFLIIAFYYLSPSQTEIYTTIKVTVWTATVLFIIGIFESITFIRPFDALYTVKRVIINEHYIRFGLLRATTTLYMPVLYGSMCVIILTFIMFLYETSRQKRYLFSIFLCLLAIIHSGSRASILFVFPICLIYYLYVLKDKKRQIDFLKNLFAVLFVLFFIIGISCTANDHMKYFYTGTAKSVLNEFGFDFDLDENAPADVDGFDSKAIKGDSKGTTSRLAQLSGIVYTNSINPLFGLGSGAQYRGDVMYLNNGKWKSYTTYDVGYVQIYCDEGIIGSLGFVFLAISLLIILHKRNTQFSHKYICMFPVSYALVLLSTVNMMNYLIFIVIVIICFNPKDEVIQ